MPDTALPRYLQISEALIREVSAGRLADGARLPSEREMAGARGVSVGTLRKALARLEEMGLLERVHGSGNYIRRPQGELGLYRFFRLERPEGGGLPTAETISVERRAKPADLPWFGTSREAHRIRRLRRVDGVPAALEEVWLDGDAAERIDPGALSESLYRFYRAALDLTITRAEDRVGLDPAPGWTPQAATLAPGEIAGFVERIGRAETGAAVEFSRTWFDAGRLRYVARLR